MLRNILLVGLGGAVGSILRYLTGYFMTKVSSSAFPMGTFLANIVGCFIIGMVYGLAQRYGWFSDTWRLLLATGFCGGYTTFSAFAFENLSLMQSQQINTLIIYIISSLILGILAVFLGMLLIKSI